MAVTGTLVPSAKKVPRRDQLMHSRGRRMRHAREGRVPRGTGVRVNVHTRKTLTLPVLSRVSQEPVEDPRVSGDAGYKLSTSHCERATLLESVSLLLPSVDVVQSG